MSQWGEDLDDLNTLSCANCGEAIPFASLTLVPTAERAPTPEEGAVQAFMAQIGEKLRDRPRVAYRCRLCRHQYEGPIPPGVVVPRP